MTKPVHAKPSLYAYYFLALKEIALKYGYNLVLHGSLNRDMDLVAIPWQEVVGSHDAMIAEFSDYLGGDIIAYRKDKTTGEWCEKYTTTHHGRMQYVINLNRKGKMVDDEWVDPQYYIDISVMPAITNAN